MIQPGVGGQRPGVWVGSGSKLWTAPHFVDKKLRIILKYYYLLNFNITLLATITLTPPRPLKLIINLSFLTPDP